ncbi:MAG: MBL fold metallo-hydrolase [archaeon]
MKIADNVYKIKSNGNVYVILKPVPIVVDTSDQANSEYIKSEIEKIIPLSEIKIVLLTHLHYDHVGNVELFPNAKIYADDDDIEDCRYDSREFNFYVSEEVDEILKKELISLPVEIGGLKVIRVPGHTRGSVAFLDEERKLLFSGDTLFASGIIGRTDFLNSVPEKMNESIGRLIGMVEDGKLLLCPGHGY